MEFTYYGFDPGFRHGALVRTTWDQPLTGPPTLRRLDPMFVWTKRDKSGIGVSDGPNEVFKFAHHLWNSLRDEPPGTLIIDFDPTSVHWRAQKMQIVQLALLMGYFSRGAHSLGFTLLFMTPRNVRNILDLPGNSKKEEVHATFNRTTRQLLDYPVLKNEDVLDACVLTWIAHLLFVGMGDDDGEQERPQPTS